MSSYSIVFFIIVCKYTLVKVCFKSLKASKFHCNEFEKNCEDSIFGEKLKQNSKYLMNAPMVYFRELKS